MRICRSRSCAATCAIGFEGDNVRSFRKHSFLMGNWVLKEVAIAAVELASAA
jgi:hypothetical protein